jgi:ribose transport system permease protein
MRTTNRLGSRERMARLYATLGILPIYLGIVVVFALLSDHFWSVDNFFNIARQASINIVLASGMTFVILTGGIDLSVGSILAVSAVAAITVSLSPAWSAFGATTGLLIGLGLGLLNGLLIAYLKLPAFIVTLGTYTGLRGAAYLLADGTTVMNPDLPFAWVGNDALGPVPWLVIVAGVVVALAWFVLRRMVFGTYVYAVGGSAQAARLAGINVARVLLYVYGISGALAGLGAVMASSRLYSANGQLGSGYELDAIAAVILGGTSFVGGVGGIVGTLIGALVIATLNNGLTLLDVSEFWQLVIKGAVIVFAVLLDRYRQHA